MLDDFVSEYNLIPESFKKNDDARLLVYGLLIKQKNHNKNSFFSMKKSDFLVMNEDVYFSMLFNELRS